MFEKKMMWSMYSKTLAKSEECELESCIKTKQKKKNSNKPDPILIEFDIINDFRDIITK